MAYTSDQIRGYADSMLASGKSWQDVWNTAQTKGVGLEQLAGAYGYTAHQGNQWLQNQGVSAIPTSAWSSSVLNQDQRQQLINYFGVDPSTFPDDINQFTTGWDLSSYLSERGDDNTRRRLDDIFAAINSQDWRTRAVEQRSGYESIGPAGDAGGSEMEFPEFFNPITQSWQRGYQYGGNSGAGPETYMTSGRSNIHTPRGEGHVVNTDFSFTRGEDGKLYFDKVGRRYGDDSTTFEDYAPFLMTALPFAASMFPSLGAALSFGTNPVLAAEATTGGAGVIGSAGGAGAGYGASGAVEPASSLFPSTAPETIPTFSLPSASTLLNGAGAASTIAKILGVGSDVAGKLLGNVGLKDIVNLLGGGLDTRNQRKYADIMLNYLSGQQAKLDQYYNPDSPEYKQLWQEMSRKDAAAGRNSQYGVRTTDFMGKVAKDRSDAQIRFMNAGGKLMEAALGQKASAPTGLMSALDKITRGSGYSLKDVVRYLSDNGVQLTSVDTDYMNGNLTDEQYRAAASAAQLDTDPEVNGAITDILGEDFDINDLWSY